MRAMNLGKNIELLRKNFGVTQEELATKLGLSRQAIYKWEKDKATPTIENIMKICELFDLDINDFLKGKIKFFDINDIVFKIVENYKNIDKPTIDEIFLEDKLIREKTLNYIKNY